MTHADPKQIILTSQTDFRSRDDGTVSNAEGVQFHILRRDLASLGTDQVQVEFFVSPISDDNGHGGWMFATDMLENWSDGSEVNEADRHKLAKLIAAAIKSTGADVIVDRD